MSTGIGRKVADLRVVDLRQELEKRGLEKAGVKGVLIERLTQAIIKEGLNPDDYVMDMMKKPGSTTPLSTSKTEDESELESSCTTTPILKVKIEPPVIELIDDDDFQPGNGSDTNGNGHEANTTVDSTNKDSASAEPETSAKEEEIAGKGEDGAAALEDETEDVVEDETEEAYDETQECDDEEQYQEEEGKDEDANVENVDDRVEEGDEGDYEEEGGEQEGEDMEEGDGDASGELEKKEDVDLGVEDESKDKANECAITTTAVSSFNNRVADDEMDQDALHLTIGEDEEDDKNYILAEEREKDKADDVDRAKQNESKTLTKEGKEASVTEPTSAGKIRKPATKVATSSQDKTQKDKSAASKPPTAESKSSSLKEKLKEKKSGGPDAGKKSDAKPAVATDKVKPEKTSQSSSNAQNAKTKIVAKDQAKDRKDAVKDPKAVNKANPRRRDARDIRRPTRPGEKPRVPTRFKPRSESPRVRRLDIPTHRQTLSFTQIREMRERERQREREREIHRRLRERERRERDEVARQREIERRNAEELALLERERQRLRLEREKVEREKEELIRMEKERQRAERERIEREKEEIRRAKIDDRSRHERSHKRSYEGERDRSREFNERKKIAVAESARRVERPAFPAPVHNAPRAHGTVVVPERRGFDAGRDRSHRHRSRSPSFSRSRDASDPRAAPHFPERETRDWRFDDAVRDGRRDKEETKEKRMEDKREVRVARSRELPLPVIAGNRAPAVDYGSAGRNDLNPPHHRVAANTSAPKSRPGDRYDMGKGKASFSGARDEQWMRRTAYGIATNSSVSAQMSNSIPNRETWNTDRKGDWSVNDRNVSMRPSINDMPDRWITGSGSTLSSGSRTATGHVPPIVPPPPQIYSQHPNMVLSCGNIPSQVYSNNRYNDYGKPAFRRY